MANGKVNVALLSFNDRLPLATRATLRLLRRRVHLSRELADDVVRARGHNCRSRFGYLDECVETPVYDEKRNATTRLWYADGTLKAKLFHVDGMYHGVQRWWHRNGILNTEIAYDNGEQHGTERWWDARGTLLSQKMFQDGVEEFPTYETNYFLWSYLAFE